MDDYRYLLWRIETAMSLPRAVDLVNAYWLYFSEWYRRVSKDYPFQDPKEYEKEQNGAPFIVDIDPETGEEVVRLSKTHVIWVVLTVHMMVGHSTDTAYVSEVLRKRLGVRGISEAIIHSIITWGTPCFNMGDEEKEISAIKARFDETDADRAVTQSRTNEVNRAVWAKVFQQHLGSPQLNPIYAKAGVVFFGLVPLANESGFSLVFIDCLTQATGFSSPFNPKDMTEMVTDIRAALGVQLRAYGQPLALLCMNPLQGENNNWFGHMFQQVFEPMAPFDTVVSTYQPVPHELPTRVAELFDDAISILLDTENSFKNSRFLSDYFIAPNADKTKNNLHPSQFYTLQMRSFVKHPRSIECGTTSDGKNISDHPIYNLSFSLPMTRVSEQAWNCISYNSPFPVDKPEPIQFKAIPGNVEKKIKKVIKISDKFPLAPSLRVYKHRLVFDETSKNIVRYLFQRKRRRARPSEVLGELEAQARVKKRVRIEEPTERQPEIIAEEADAEENRSGENEKTGEKSGMENAEQEFSEKQHYTIEEEQVQLVEEVTEKLVEEKHQLVAEPDKEGEQGQLAEAETQKQRLDEKEADQVRLDETEPEPQPEKQRLADQEAEQKRLADADAEKQRLADQEAERKRLADADAEKQRLADQEAEQKRLAEEEAEKKRLAEEEAEKKRLADAQAEKQRLVEQETERKRLAEVEAEKKRLVEQETERKRLAEAEAEKQRLAEVEAEKKRLVEQEAEKKRLAEVEAENQRLVEQEAEKQRLADQEAEKRRLAEAEAEKKRLAEQEAEKRRLAEAEAEKKRLAEQEAEKRRLAEAEAEKKRLAEQEAEKQRLADQEAEQKRLAEAEAEEKRLAEQEAEKKRLAEVEAEKKRLAEADRTKQAEIEKAERIRRFFSDRKKLSEEAREDKRQQTERVEEQDRTTRAEQANEADAAEKKRLAEEAERERLADIAAEEQRLAIEAADKERAAAEEQSKLEVDKPDSPKAKAPAVEVEIEKTAAEKAAENLKLQKEWRRREAERQKEIDAILAAERKEKAAKEAAAKAEAEAAAKAKAEAEAEAKARAETEATSSALNGDRVNGLEDDDLPPTKNPITAFLRSVQLALNRAPQRN